jgi:ABC-type transport system involved in cytochrome bd biosynthesis fused ATPase/permease subunit
LVAESRVSLSRIETFLLAEEITERITYDDEDTPIRIVDGSYSWTSSTSDNVKDTKAGEKYAQFEDEKEETNDAVVDVEKSTNTLHNINLRVHKASLTCVVGLVGKFIYMFVHLYIGSGKSSLLSAIIGEMKQTNGETRVSSNKIAYCPQQSWIQNGTVKENIVFGLPFDANKYKQAIRCCCLERDLEILPAGDQTEIGN